MQAWDQKNNDSNNNPYYYGAAKLEMKEHTAGAVVSFRKERVKLGEREKDSYRLLKIWVLSYN